jgi:hypothetical protein
MNNPNNLFKENGADDPLDECPSLQEYILELIDHLASAQCLLEMCQMDMVKTKLNCCMEVVKEMATGNWKILKIEENDEA